MKKIVMFFVLILLLVNVSAVAMAAEETTTRTCSKDKFVDNTGGYTSWAYGDRAALYVGHYASFGVSTSALNFNVSTMPSNIQSIKLRLPISYVQGSAQLNLYGSVNDSWSETGTDMPAASSLLHSETLTANNSGSTQWKEIDVTAYVQGEMAGDNLATFLLTGNTSGDINFQFYAREDSYERPELLVTYTVATVEQTPVTALNENNLESVNINLTLDDTTFADSSLSVANFTSNTSNVSVASVTYNSATSATLRLTNNRADFDSNFTYNITINSSELTTGASIVSNNVTVTAVNDSESISAALDGDGITQSFENGEVISVTLSGGVFSSSLTASNWSLNNFRTGVTIGSVTRVDDTHANITLSGDAPDGGTSDITNAYISCNGSEYSDGSSTLSSGNLTLYVYNDDPPSITTNTAPTLDRGSSVVLTTSFLSATDPDSNDSTIEFTITSALSNGQLEYTANPNVAISSFTQQDLIDSNVVYVHDDSNTVADSFVFKASDGTNELTGQTFNIDINPTAVEGIHYNSTSATMDIGENRTIGHTFTPSDPYNTDVTYSTNNATVSTVAVNGEISANAVGVAYITITSDDTTNGTISDTLRVEVVDPLPEDPDAFRGTIEGSLVDSTGAPLEGYTVALYSTPIYAVTAADGSFAFSNVPYDHHTLIVSDSSDNEVGRFSLSFAIGTNTAQSVDNALNTANITYINRTQSVELSIQSNAALDDIDINNIDFTNSPAINPQTGDKPSNAIWAILLCAILAITAFISVFKKPRVHA